MQSSKFDEIQNSENLDEIKKNTSANSDQIKNSLPLTKNKVLNERYEFEKTTIIISLQILPTTSESRKVLISAGITGEPPIISNTTIADIQQSPAIAEILTELNQTLPQIAALAQKRQDQEHTLQEKQQKTVQVPELPSANSTSTKPSNQLSLL